MPRPAVDVIVPFAGPDRELDALIARLSALASNPEDRLIVADNRAGAGTGTPQHGRVQILNAGDRAGSYHARNRGARAGQAPWLLFIDADVEPAPDLLDRLFEPAPAEKTAILAGGILDEAPADPARETAALRYARLRRSMSQEQTLVHGFAQTANCAVRRAAFDALGGFAEVRSGGDADLCLRASAAGWNIEERRAAEVVHRNRATIPAMLAQRARHGAGAAWLSRQHPGTFEARNPLGIAWWGAKRAVSGLGALARGDRDEAVLGLLDGPTLWAFELGRLLPNRRRQGR
ncbi:MAG TPA: glycosyltransferase [Solirubrobacteraceae bacterium]|nr:glycosyltransferase [Solirubrobacteraceae bacterium]